MPWMICKCDKRFYALPSEMIEARCDECKNGPKPPEPFRPFADPIEPTDAGIVPGRTLDPSDLWE